MKNKNPKSSKTKRHTNSSDTAPSETTLTMFCSPLTGTVLEATAARVPIETRQTPLGIFVTAVDGVRPDNSGGFRYWVNNRLGRVSADKCPCNAGDMISWMSTTEFKPARMLTTRADATASAGGTIGWHW